MARLSASFYALCRGSILFDLKWETQMAAPLPFFVQLPIAFFALLVTTMTMVALTAPRTDDQKQAVASVIVELIAEAATE